MTLEKSARLMDLTWSYDAPPTKKLHSALYSICRVGEESKSDSLCRAKHPNREALRLY